jgi:hypothetical protein
MVLPVFLTGGTTASGTTAGADETPAPPPRPARRDEHPDRLPASERGMLIFVASLLTAGALAVVATMGFSTLTSHHSPDIQPVTSTSAAPSPSR